MSLRICMKLKLKMHSIIMTTFIAIVQLHWVFLCILRFSGSNFVSFIEMSLVVSPNSWLHCTKEIAQLFWLKLCFRIIEVPLCFSSIVFYIFARYAPFAAIRTLWSFCKCAWSTYDPLYDKVGESRRGSNVFYFLFVESNNAPPMGQHLSLDQRSTKRCPLTLYG